MKEDELETKLLVLQNQMATVGMNDEEEGAEKNKEADEAPEN